MGTSSDKNTSLWPQQAIITTFNGKVYWGLVSVSKVAVLTYKETTLLKYKVVWEQSNNYSLL